MRWLSQLGKHLGTRLGTCMGALALCFGTVIAEDDDGLLLVADSQGNALHLVNTETGLQVTFSSDEQGTGPSFETPVSVAWVPSGFIVVADSGLNALLRVDPATGNRRILSGDGVGGGPGFINIRDVSVGADGRIWVVDNQRDGLILVDATTGNRQVVLDGVETPVAVAADPAGGVWILDQSDGQVVHFDPETNTTTANRSWQVPGVPVSLELVGDGSAVLADRAGDQLLRMDLRTGDVTIIADNLDSLTDVIADIAGRASALLGNNLSDILGRNINLGNVLPRDIINLAAPVLLQGVGAPGSETASESLPALDGAPISIDGGFIDPETMAELPSSSG